MTDRPILREMQRREREAFPLFHLAEDPQVRGPGPHPTATGRHDPPTSAEAERRHTRGGKRGAHVALVAEAVRHFPGCTATELHAHLGRLERHEWSRRLADAAAEGLVRRGPPRACLITGRSCVTWNHAEANP